MTKPSRLRLASYVRPVCLLLCFSLAAPSAAVSAALSTPRKAVESHAGSGSERDFSAPASGNEAASFAAARSEAASSNRAVEGARAGAKLAATFTEVQLGRTVDKRGVDETHSLSAARRKVTNAPVRSSLAGAGRVVRVVPPVGKVAATGAPEAGGGSLARMDKLTDGAGYGSFFKGGAGAPVEPVFSANVAKENHASGVAPVAVGSSDAASPRREVDSRHRREGVAGNGDPART